jgi:LPXTG-site transpeptidase (sortase) family protein
MPKHTKHSTFPLSIYLISVGLTLLSLWGLHRYFYTRSISLSDTILAAYKSQRSATASYPIHLEIDEITNVPIVEAGRQNGIWTVSNTSANHVIQSAIPGENGNIIIYGHNLNIIFGFLMNIKIGAIINVRLTDGSLHRYTVTETHVVTPTQTELLAPTTHEVLTLYTCTGLLDSLRFVVRAVPTGDATSAPSSQSPEE